MEGQPVTEGGYRSLRVYRLSHELGIKIHRMTLGLPKFELYEEGSQIRRSSKRVSASIVEGYALRRYKAEYLHYLYRAYGSAEETVEHLDYLRKTDSFTDESLYHALRAECLELNRQLFRFIQGVDREHDTPYSLKESPADYANDDPDDIPFPNLES
ncbi:four helix bundle protein [bacterium]|nr:four helix bundle protein [bacterium]